MDPYPREDETTDPEIWMDTIRGVESRATTEQQADGEWYTRRRLLLWCGAQRSTGKSRTKDSEGQGYRNRDEMPAGHHGYGQTQDWMSSMS
jgi:hypothetical protein